MRTILEIQRRLAPDFVDVLRKRYNILRHIQSSGLVGRRTLASALHMTERVLRAETEFLKRQGLLETSTGGMQISDEGARLLAEMEPMMKEWIGLYELEEQIAGAYKL